MLMSSSVKTEFEFLEGVERCACHDFNHLGCPVLCVLVLLNQVLKSLGLRHDCVHSVSTTDTEDLENLRGRCTFFSQGGEHISQRSQTHRLVNDGLIEVVVFCLLC